MGDPNNFGLSVGMLHPFPDIIHNIDLEGKGLGGRGKSDQRMELKFSSIGLLKIQKFSKNWSKNP